MHAVKLQPTVLAKAVAGTLQAPAPVALRGMLRQAGVPRGMRANVLAMYYNQLVLRVRGKVATPAVAQQCVLALGVYARRVGWQNISAAQLA